MTLGEGERGEIRARLRFLKQFRLMLLYLLQMFYVISGGVFFGRTKSSTFPFFAPPTHFHFFFVFHFDVSSALLLVPLRSVEHGAACSAKLAIKTWKIMSFHERSRFKLNSRLYANSFHFI